jgi:putative ABC transport system permease protein
MTLFALALAYLRAKPWNTALNVLLLALGVATVTVLALATEQLEARMSRDARGVDLAIGAKGSPLQLVLAAVFHLDAPAGNVPLADTAALAKHPLVRRAIPLALGDAYRGYRIVGTTHDYTALYDARPAAGRLWSAPLEAVLGAEVARAAGASVGANIVGAHGLGDAGEGHDATPYAVVGVLAPTGTVIDRLVLTSVESVWLQHITPAADEKPADILAALADDEKEVTALLVQYASPLAAATLPRLVNASAKLQAASPAFESARLFNIIGVGVDVLRAFAIVLVAAAALSILIALYNALEERRYDLAVMRMMGAPRGTIVRLVLLEGTIVATAGALAGLALGHVFASLLGAALAAQKQPAITGAAFVGAEIVIAAVAIAVGLAAALIPAWRAYRRDVAATLADR